MWAFEDQMDSSESPVTVVIHENDRVYDTALKFSIQTGVVSSAWITVPVATVPTRTTTCDYELMLSSVDQVIRIENKPENAPSRYFYWDIECVNGSKTQVAEDIETGVDRFVDAKNPTNQIVMIGGLVASVPLATEPCTRVLFKLRSEDDKDAAESVRTFVDPKTGIENKYTRLLFDTEEELLYSFSVMAVILDVDVLCHFNGNYFDVPYVMNRLNYLMGGPYKSKWHPFFNMSRSALFHWPSRWVPRVGNRMTIQRYVDEIENPEVVHEAEGRASLDMRVFIQDTMKGVTRYKLPAYDLNGVAALLGTSKFDMPPKEMFRLWHFGESGERGTFDDYCMQDVELLMMLNEQEKFTPLLFAMAGFTRLSVHQVINLGPTAKANAQYNAGAHALGMFVNQFDIGKYKYTGAVVLTPMQYAFGIADPEMDEATDETLNPQTIQNEMVAYLVKHVLTQEERRIYRCDDVVMVGDYASLYPSIMMWLKLCLSLIVLPGVTGHSAVEIDEMEPPENGKHHPSLEVREIVIREDASDPTSAVLRKHCFVANAEEPFTHGIIPKDLADMKKMRGEFKKLAKTGPPEMRGVYDGRQLAIKIIMNTK